MSRMGISKASRAGKKAARTRKANATKRSTAAKKGWKTRRAATTKRSNATKHSVSLTEKKLPKKGGKRSGVIYGITNPDFEGWVKLGFSVKRGKAFIEGRYNTASPHRNYRLIEEAWVNSRAKAEKRLHELAEKKSSKKKNEWFKMTQKDAKKLIKKVGKEF